LHSFVLPCVAKVFDLVVFAERSVEHGLEDGAALGEDPRVAGNALHVGLATHEEDDVAARFALDQRVSEKREKRRE
jgi:hypothetical protein